ncbi:MAG: complex I subunit 5 family protein [Nitriliruptoraceae bacterium]
MTVVLWLAPLVLPLLLAGVVTARPGPRSWALLAVAPLPALVLALVGPVLDPPALPWLLLEVHLALDGVGRLLLVLTALAWTVAGVYSRAEVEQQGGYAAWWLLSLSGNVGVLLADDVLTFYTAFVVMTLAAYGLVVHTRTATSRRAGRAYLVLGVAGETLLLAGLLLAVADATGLRLPEVATAVASSDQRDLIVGLLVAGFGIKAGLLGLHVWLPLAHPAAPFPASAVLSGAMIKAGLVGWLRLLPVGEVALPAWSTLLVGLGLAGAFVGVLLGLTHTSPKVLLAYSSVSQMGFVALLVGVAIGTPAVAPIAAAAAAAYALHHGLAKAVLFLGVGLWARATRPRQRSLLLGGIVVAGASLAGLPLTSGAFAKAWMKDSVALGALPAGVTTATSLAAAGTTLLMLRLLVLLRAQPVPAQHQRIVLGPWLALSGTVVALTPVLVPRLLAELPLPSSSSLIRDALWPALLGAGLAAAAVTVARRTSLRLPTVPAGDLVVLEERAVAGLADGLARTCVPVVAATIQASLSLRDAVARLARHGPLLDRIEDRLTRWSTGGAMVALVAAALLLALSLDPPTP